MEARPALAAVFIALMSGCATPVMQPVAAGPVQQDFGVAVPLLAERNVSLYADHQVIQVPSRAPTTSLGVVVPEGLHIRAIRVTFDNGEEAMITTKTEGRVDIPGPPRQLREVELLYASQAPPDTYATIRLYDLSVPEELVPAMWTAQNHRR